MKRIKIFNGKIITPQRIIADGTVVVSGEKISELGDRRIEVNDAIEINARGNYISPGFIDIHVHGGAGHDFMDATETAFLEIAALHARYGTTSMLPTTLSSTKEEMLKALQVYESANKKNVKGAQFLGMHLEGPYFAMNQRGAQDPRFIRNPDPSEYEEILARSSVVKRWSAAPELKGAVEFGQYLRSKKCSSCAGSY